MTRTRTPHRAWRLALITGFVVAALCLPGGCQQEMSRTDKGYTIPSFKGVTTGLNSPGTTHTSGSASTSQNK